MVRWTLVATLVAVGIQSAWAQWPVFVGGTELHRACASGAKNEYDNGFCTGYVLGSVDMLARAKRNPAQLQQFCIPDGMDSRQLRQLVTRFLDANPDARHAAGAPDFVMGAIGTAYKCP